MALTEKYLNQLIADKTTLANNLTTKGVTASSDETFTELVPKVLDIQSGGNSEITKGIIIKEFDSNGYVTDAEIVGMTTIPNNYFYQSSGSINVLGKIEKIKTYNEITSIGKYAFYYCSSLALIELSNNLTSIGSNAFFQCSNLALTSLPDSLQTIGDYAFYYCSKLALTSLPDNLQTIGKYAFQYCSKLALTSLPNGINTINSYAFDNCSNLALTSLPDNLQTISSNAFRYCSKLALTSLPNGINTINSYAFENCKSLTEITCQGVITSIGQAAFQYCSNLSKFVLPNITSVPTLSTSVFANTPIASGTGYIYVPDDLVGSFQTATNWSTYAAQIKGISELPTE